MAREASPELLEGFEALRSGEWIPGPRLINAMGQRIAPGPAERWARAHMANPDAYGRDDLVAMGRRRIAQIRIAGLLLSGRWETDPREMTRAHWRGDRPFRVRDLLPGAIAFTEAAEQLGITPALLDQWIRAGLAPEPDRVKTTARAERFVTPATLEIYRKMVAAYPGTGKSNWDPHPHTFWKVTKPVHYCPHCGYGIVIDPILSRAPGTEGTPVQ